jgi:hypothetical protein
MCAKHNGKHRVLGLKHLIKDIGFDNADTWNITRMISQYMTNDYIGAHYLGGHTSLLYQVLSDSGFDKRVIRVKLLNLKGTGGA